MFVGKIFLSHTSNLLEFITLLISVCCINISTKKGVRNQLFSERTSRCSHCKYDACPDFFLSIDPVVATLAIVRDRKSVV